MNELKILKFILDILCESISFLYGKIAVSVESTIRCYTCSFSDVYEVYYITLIDVKIIFCKIHQNNIDYYDIILIFGRES